MLIGLAYLMIASNKSAEYLVTALYVIQYINPRSI